MKLDPAKRVNALCIQQFPAIADMYEENKSTKQEAISDIERYYNIGVELIPRIIDPIRQLEATEQLDAGYRDIMAYIEDLRL